MLPRAVPPGWFRPGPAPPRAGDRPPAGRGPAGPGRPGRHGPLRDLERPADAFASLGPNWFASVMGTGIVATAAATLPVQWPGLRGFATAIWVLAAGWLLVLAAAEIVHWTRHRQAALGHARNPVMVQFYGAPPMALLTVGAGALLLGPGLIGAQAALIIDAVLWPLGTLAGLASSLAVPYLMFTRLRAAPGRRVRRLADARGPAHGQRGHRGPAHPAPARRPAAADAAAGVLRHVRDQPDREHGGDHPAVAAAGPALGRPGRDGAHALDRARPARAVHHRGRPARRARRGGSLPSPYGAAFQAFGVVYGVPVWGFALLWAALATAITIRAARARIPFSLTWWSFTFPLGTLVTGTTSLALHTGAGLFRWTAVGLYLALVAAWVVVSVRTVAGTWRGSLLRAAPRGRCGGWSRDEVGTTHPDGGQDRRPACLDMVPRSAAGGHRASPPRGTRCGRAGGHAGGQAVARGWAGDGAGCWPSAWLPYPSS